MSSKNVRELQACWDGTILVTAAFEKFISVWSTRTFELIREIDSTMDFGGSRLAVSPDDQHVFVGAYHRHGVAAYEALSGKEIWRRRDVKRVQRLAASYNEAIVFACFSDQSAQALSVQDGTTIFKKRMVRDFLDGPLNRLSLLDINHRKYELYAANGDKLPDIKIEGCCLQGSAFTNGSFAIADHGCFVRCFSTENGDELWRFTPTYGSHVVALAYNPREDAFFGVESPYAFDGSTDLIALHPRTGECISRKAVGRRLAFAFINRASQLACSDGTVFDAVSCEIVCKMPFPQD